MSTSHRIKLAIAAVSTLIGAVSGWIKGIAPPEDGGTALAVGMVALSSVFALLLIQAIASSGKQMSKLPWYFISVALFIGAVTMFFVYTATSDRVTITCPKGGDPVVIGELTSFAKENLPRYSNDLCKEIAAAGGMREYRSLSVPGSIESSRQRLRGMYFGFVLLLLSAIFCLTDGALATGKVGSRKPKRTTETNQPKP